MLYNRIITGLILGLTMIGGFLYSFESAIIICLVILFFTCLEWHMMMRKISVSPSNLLMIISLFISVLIIIGIYFNMISLPHIFQYILCGISLVFIFKFIEITFSRNYVKETIENYYLVPYLVLPILILIFFLNGNFVIHSKWILSMIAMNWSNDVFAYFVGRKFGKTPLAPEISPKKTIEGSIGGLVGAILTGICLNLYFLNEPVSLLFIIIFGIFIWAFGTVGDLFESKLKRLVQIKDSGNILPGHGGFLDRFDSFLFIIPVGITLVYFFNFLNS
ncbi:MAG: phosphatidate cytidylyltransferase [Saprospiraceae bacterium]|nr:phosphatidate cytidylyltransferase [Saprospiraceae bacterium]